MYNIAFLYAELCGGRKFLETTSGFTARGDTHKLLKLGNVSSEKSQAGSVYDEDGISMTLCAGTHGYAMGYILVKKEN